jgi:DNA-binding MarR family transcriptional regulator
MTGVTIDLTPDQVDQVVRSAYGTGNMSLLLAKISRVGERLGGDPEQLDDVRFSRSVLQALMLLSAFPDDGTYRGNHEIARALGMSKSTAHRYMTTFVVAGLLERDPVTRKYRLSRS